MTAADALAELRSSLRGLHECTQAICPACDERLRAGLAAAARLEERLRDAGLDR